MSKIGVSLSINVSKIAKGRLYKGAKGTYLDCTAFIDLDELDQYGNSGMITQDVTKEEKEAKVKGPILGNSKVFWKDMASGGPNGRGTEHRQDPAAPSFDDNSDIPW